MKLWRRQFLRLAAGISVLPALWSIALTTRTCQASWHKSRPCLQRATISAHDRFWKAD
jgi:hypothetical protein